MSVQLMAQKPKFSVAIQTDTYRKLINNTLQDPKRASRFVSSISSAVATNKDLQECDAGSILSCALLGESLELSPSPQLGQYYLVPFNEQQKDKDGNVVYEYDASGNILKDKYGNKKKLFVKKAQFILGYKGYIQLAIRSGQYKKLNVVSIKQSELIRYDPLNEEIEVRLIQDETTRESTETIGYYAMFEYLNGFRKTMYWSKEKMEEHAMKYSAGYRAKKGYTFWEKDFDGMAYKTMLRQLISKWGIMSIELRTAMETDNSIINENGTSVFVETEEIESVPYLETEQENYTLEEVKNDNNGSQQEDIVKKVSIDSL